MSNAYADVRLQKKVAVTLLLTMAAFAAVSYLILARVIAPAFGDLELDAARSDLVRAQQAIQTDIRNLQAITADWAPWDDIHDYVLGQNPGFKRSNLDRPTLLNLDLDMMAVYGTGSRFIWSQLLLAGEPVDPQELGILGPDDPTFMRLSRHASADSETVGIVRTLLGPMIVSSRPILRSDNSGPVAGALVMGQFLDDDRIAVLRERTEVKLHWSTYTELDSHSVDNMAAFGSEQITFPLSEKVMLSQVLLDDILGEPALLLETRTRRSISMLGTKTVGAATLFLLFTGLSLTVVMWFLLRATVLRPIEQLVDHMATIRKSGDLSRPFQYRGNDEIGELATEFNRLTTDVHDARQELLLQTYKAGKADTAAEVLHNIRNAMTPLINGVERIAKAFRVTDSLRVGEATAQLRGADCPPERAQKLLEYIDASFEHIGSSNADASDDMRIVMSQARQVEDILADQERFANEAPAVENVAIAAVADEASQVIPKEAKRSINLQMCDTLQSVRVHANRIGLLQVLGNLILNAYESIQRASQRQGLISVSASTEVVDDQEMVRLVVRDNGTGFAGEACQKVFQRGFTSKGEGDTKGLGLHWCANAVAGMGGRISAQSAGPGQGAEFHLLLPVAQGG